jgi:hypothetical protein
MEKVFQKVRDEGYEGYLFINLSIKSSSHGIHVRVLKLTDKLK